MNFLGVESIDDLDFTAEDNLGQVNVEIVEDVGEKTNNNLPLITDRDASTKIKTESKENDEMAHLWLQKDVHSPT